jgi:hypothetical protein
MILDISVKESKWEKWFDLHISKGEQVREMILDISVKGNKW